MSGEKVQIAARIPADLADWLKTEAEDRDVSQALLVRRALENFRDYLRPVDELLGVDDQDEGSEP